MQCTPDVSPSNCRNYLQQFIAYYKRCCNWQQGGYAQKPNCVFRWDLYPFLNFLPRVTSPFPSSPLFIISLLLGQFLKFSLEGAFYASALNGDIVASTSQTPLHIS
jgi:hypothetical protein